MKVNYFLIIIFIICSSSFAYCQDADFRNTRWGMTREEVIKTETKKPVIDETNLVAYEDAINGLSCLVFYRFIEDKLTNTVIGFTQTHTNRNDFIADYKNLKQLLIKKYGNPKDKEDLFWKNDLYRNNYQDWGFAVSLGHLSYISVWETNNTSILLDLMGENYKISLFIKYESKQYKELEEKQYNKDSLKGL